MEISDPISSILVHKPNREVWSIPPDATMFEAIEVMAQRNVGALLVMNGGDLLGIVSERDYTRKIVLHGRSSRTTPVREIMTTRVVCVDPGTQVDACLQLMTNERVRHLPVVDGNTVVGVLSIGDLVKRIISVQGAMIAQLEQYIVGSYPA